MSISCQKCLPNIAGDVSGHGDCILEMEEALSDLSPHFAYNAVRAIGYPKNSQDLGAFQ